MGTNLTRRKMLQTLTVGGITVTLSGCQVTSIGEDPTPTDTPTRSPGESTMPDRHGPMRSGRFTVAIDDVEVAGFAHVTIPSNRTEGDWGQTTHDDLVMERAVLKGDSTLREWRDDVLAGKVDSGSRSVAITLQDEEGEPQIVWEFADAWIREYEPPELVATEDDQGGSIATETIRVAFDELNRVEG